jgi:hypothetical protein
MSGRSLSTHGWDTVFAVRIEDANRLLRRQPAQPKRFRLEVDAKVGAPTAAAEWLFAPWAIEEASGSQVVITTQFAGGRLLHGEDTVDLAGLGCTITCEMVLKPVAAAGKGETRPHRLDPAGPPSEGWAAIDIQDDEGRLSFSHLDALIKCLGAWFQTEEALAEFEAHFAGLVINTAEAKDKLTWLAPRAVGFAGAIMADGSPAIGILARTAGGDIIGCSYQLSSYAIPDGAQAGFIISAETFLRNVLRPALPHAFAGTEDDYAVYDGNKIRNVRPVELQLKTGDGHRFYGTIAPGKLDIALFGPELVLRIHDLAIPIDWGPFKKVQTFHFVMEHRFGLTLMSPDGTPGHKVLSLTETKAPQPKLSNEDSIGLDIAKTAVEFVALVGAAVASHFTGRGAASKGLSKIASKVLAGIVFVAIEGAGYALTRLPDIMADIERGSLRKLPDFSAFLDRNLRHICWPNATDYELTSAAFCDSVQFGVRLSTKTG